MVDRSQFAGDSEVCLSFVVNCPLLLGVEKWEGKHTLSGLAWGLDEGWGIRNTRELVTGSAQGRHEMRGGKADVFMQGWEGSKLHIHWCLRGEIRKHSRNECLNWSLILSGNGCDMVQLLGPQLRETQTSRAENNTGLLRHELLEYIVCSLCVCVRARSLSLSLSLRSLSLYVQCPRCVSVCVCVCCVCVFVCVCAYAYACRFLGLCVCVYLSI